MSDLNWSIALLLVAIIQAVLGFVGGWYLMKSKHYGFLAEGFRMMGRQTDARGLGFESTDALTCSARDVSNAFGPDRAGLS